ncbi:uncharacterized protein LOC132750416 [Ruditapes philippinarum]|uniref:uncharacterized protein LOC132750416 n=1 Tax=Ruditapes philippinarum TaxID=129788 RepID=UPI00295AC68E|nr:uncharacterized protein LOC132750416 [Ruditapes philippinarum]
MPLKKKRVSAFEVKCKETVIDERTKSKNKHKSDKPKSKHVEVVDAINSLPKEKQIEYVKSGNKKKSRKSKKGKKSAKANSISPKAVAKTKQKSEQEDNGDTNISMVVIDDDNEESDIASDLVDIQAGGKTVDTDRPEDNRNTDSDSIDSDVHSKHENIKKRKIGSLENDKTAVVKKKSKRDFNKESETQPSEKSIEESVDDRDDWTDIGRRLQSRAGYGDHFDSGQPSTHKSPIAIPVGDSVLVIASHPCVFPLKGVVTIQAVVGTASVMEYNLVPGSQGYDVYSPDCNSLVTVSTVKGVTKTKTAVNQVDSMLGINDKTVINVLKNSLNDSKLLLF